jgi:hypothetical protein
MDQDRRTAKGIGGLDRVYRGDASQPGDGVGNGGIAERNKVAEYLVTGFAPLPTEAGDRAAEILAGEQSPYGGAPHQSGGVGSVRGIGACGFDDEEINRELIVHVMRRYTGIARRPAARSIRTGYSILECR